MPRGYMEGPAAEEAERRAEELERGIVHDEAPPTYPAVFGCTADDPEPHFIGWLADVDPDELVDRQRGERLDPRRAACAERDRDARDRRGVRRLDDVHEVELAERRPLVEHLRTELFDVLVHLAQAIRIRLQRRDALLGEP